MQLLTSYYKEKADLRDDKHRLKALRSQPTPQSYSSTTQGLASLATDNDDQLASEAAQASIKLPDFFPPPPTDLPLPLPIPVFIPQRRQGDRLRGFQLLYAPLLTQSSVSEEQFISFLHRLNVAIGFDNRIKILNFAVDIATIACSTWEVVVATVAAQALSTTAAHVKSRSKSEAFVAHANERFWHPRGLHAQIVPVVRLDPSCSDAINSDIDNGNSDDVANVYANEKSSFQFSPGSPHVLPLFHPKAKGGLFNLNKRPIEYDPFDYGPGHVKVLPHQYCPLRPSQYRESANSPLDKVAEKVESYNVWQDRLPAKKYARKVSRREEKIDKIRQEEGEAGVLRFLQQEGEERQKASQKDKSKVGRLLDRNKVVLIITNLEDDVRTQMQTTLADADR